MTSKNSRVFAMSVFSLVLGLGVIVDSAHADDAAITRLRARIKRLENRVAVQEVTPGQRGPQGPKGDPGISPNAAAVAQQAAALNQPSISQVDARVSAQQSTIDANAAFRNQWITSLPNMALYLSSYVSPQVDYLANELRPYINGTVRPLINKMTPRLASATTINADGTEVQCRYFNAAARGCLSRSGCTIDLQRQTYSGGNQFPDAARQVYHSKHEITAGGFNTGGTPQLISVLGLGYDQQAAAFDEAHDLSNDIFRSRNLGNGLSISNGIPNIASCANSLQPFDPAIDSLSGGGVLSAGQPFNGPNIGFWVLSNSQNNADRFRIRVISNPTLVEDGQF